MKTSHITCKSEVLTIYVSQNKKYFCKILQKKYFYKSRLHCFSNKNVLTENNEDFLSVNGAQSVRLEKGAIKFKI